MFQLNKLLSISKKNKRVGRGGDHGGTSGKGHKGQKARSGAPGELKGWFEGGQMPLSRRLPKRGFNNKFKKIFKLINLDDLEKSFSSGDLVNKEILYTKGILKGKGKFLVKVLCTGQLTKNLNVCVDACSKSAIEAIEKSGGKVELSKEA